MMIEGGGADILIRLEEAGYESVNDSEEAQQLRQDISLLEEGYLNYIGLGTAK